MSDGRAPPDGRETWALVLPWDLHHAGGVNEVVKNLHAELQGSERYQPLVWINDAIHARPTKSVIGGRETVRFGIRAPWFRPHSIRHLFSYVLTLPATLRRLSQLITRERIGVINLHYPTLSGLSLVVLRALQRHPPVLILSLHGIEITTMAESVGLERLLWRWLVRRADHIVCCSEALRSEFLVAMPVNPERVHTVHNGINLARTKNESQVHAPPEALMDRRFLLCVATLEQKKGQDVLLEAFRIVGATHADLSLVLVGRSTAWESRLTELINTHPARERIFVFRDMSHDRVLAVFRHAEMLILPSRREPFGIVLLEAAAFHTPIVATRVGGIPEVVTDGETGTLVNPDDAPQLAAAICKLLGDAGLRQRQTDAMHARTGTRFTWQSACSAYMALAETQT